MTQERVDKGWQSKGLQGYSTAAILGTLGHYGVKLDEAAVAELSKSKYPLAIAEEWLSGWKGTGQFSRFPIAAADELWRRTQKDRLAPADFALAVVQLITALDEMRRGSPEAPVGERFKSVNELRARIPTANGRPEEPFLREVVFHLGDWLERLNHLAEELAREGHVDDAADFADIEELIFPDRAGTAKALVRAAQGEKDAAISDLERIAAEGADRRVRLNAVDGLLHLEAFDKAKRHAERLFEEAEKDNDFHLGLEVGERIRYVLKKLPRTLEGKELLDRVDRLAELHAQAHRH